VGTCTETEAVSGVGIDTESSPDRLAVIVIGAGFGGVATAARLREAGVDDFVVLERAQRVGGTWRDAVYPGAEVDVPTWLYSLSFAPNPEWSKLNCSAPEILAYIENIVTRFGLAPHLRFGAEVVRAEFDESAGGWVVTTADGREFTARAVIAAEGVFSNADYPDLPGLGEFDGDCILSARWPQGYDVTGKRVAVVGTGASAVQIVPELVKQAEHVSVFQRTPAWVLPRLNFEVPQWLKRVQRRFPAVQRALRAMLFLGFEVLVIGSIRISPLTGVVEGASRWHLRSQVKDPELRAQLTPAHRIGCKRPVLTNTFYPALQQRNCVLVPHAVVGITERGLRAADGSEHEVDCIVFATGYDVGGRGTSFQVVGKGGRVLGDEWARGMVGYKSVQVSGYPNLFCIMGPNSFGHTSLLLFVEEQVGYAVRAVKEILRLNLRELDVRPEVQDAHNRMLQRRLTKSVFASGCRSWYLTDDGFIGTAYPGTVTAYRRQMAEVQLRDYVVVAAEAQRNRGSRRAGDECLGTRSLKRVES
jgi:cation diffusion facilitator CzcD-associated flavoprotein CzcO